MERYYFTFGSDERFPYRYGWVEVDAPDEHKARQIFSLYYPNRADGCLNCAFVYSEEEFVKTVMFKGTYGDRCHARISVKLF